MSFIQLLDQATINQIAAGEVIERPSAVVKELVENAIDAGATAVTVEIKEGGIGFIRITDNGLGIAKEDIPIAFQRHSTSKIKSAEDLLHISSLGFRGEALSSICAVSQVELVTKTRSSFMGIRYVIEGGIEKTLEEIGCPEGTTFIVRNLFYNTPARRKFLKTAATEAGYIGDLMERLSVSHPEISFKFMNNNQLKLHTSGNGKLKDVIYHIYGREITAQTLEVHHKTEIAAVTGYICKPVVARGNRNHMNYFINGRYIKSNIIHKAIEDAYKPYMMSHRYPFTVLHFSIDSKYIDVNVHPTKMEIRFTNQEAIYQIIQQTLSELLKYKELIPEVSLEQMKKTTVSTKTAAFQKAPEPFETTRIKEEKTNVKTVFLEEEAAAYSSSNQSISAKPDIKAISSRNLVQEKTNKKMKHPDEHKEKIEALKEWNKLETENNNSKEESVSKNEQLNLFENKLLSNEGQKKHKIIGQIFRTYWIIEYEDKMFLIDQHAAHEKVLYEKLMKSLKEKKFLSQMLEPPLILSLSMREEEALKKNKDVLAQLGFEIEAFGGKEYSVRGVPADLLGIAQKDLLIELIDTLVEDTPAKTSELILEKAASMSCKAAVKGNQNLSFQEAETLIDYLMTLENPYHCPHGRPVIVSMSKYEIEKKFKRII